MLIKGISYRRDNTAKMFHIILLMDKQCQSNSVAKALAAANIKYASIAMLKTPHNYSTF